MSKKNKSISVKKSKPAKKDRNLEKMYLELMDMGQFKTPKETFVQNPPTYATRTYTTYGVYEEPI